VQSRDDEGPMIGHMQSGDDEDPRIGHAICRLRGNHTITVGGVCSARDL
jgi:hypothetical protein